MQLTSFTDYALRVLMFVGANPERLVLTSEICEKHGISQNHLVKVVNKLGNLGFLTIKRGRNGGIRLGKEAKTINIGEFVVSIEPHMNIVECFHSEKNTCPISASCKLIPIFQRAQQAFVTELSKYTLEDILENPSLYSP